MLRVALAGLALMTIAAAPSWTVLPPTPRLAPGIIAHTVRVEGAELWVGTIGAGSPVLMLHGGLDSSDWWGLQVPALVAAGHTVVLIDSRGQGRSMLGTAALTYDRMGEDAIAVLDALGIARADVVGWSDGAIVALDLAVRHPARVGRVVSFAANIRVDGGTGTAASHPAFAAYVARTEPEYRRLSPAPDQYGAIRAALTRLWSTEPDWPDARLATITAPVLVLRAEHDEAIRGAHAAEIAHAIPGGRLVTLHGVSHFAMIQNAAGFNKAVLDFLR